MNWIQKGAVIVGGLLMTAMLLYRPFHLIAGGPRTLGEEHAFYAPLWAPRSANATVNVALLLTQWLLVMAVTMAAVLMAKKRAE